MYIQIKNNKFKLKVCNSQLEKNEGMMNKKFTDFDGMFFLMGDSFHCFFMKNCIIPLDIIFIDKNFRISKIFNNCPPCDEEYCETYCSEGKYVLELYGGTCLENSISVGDKCSFLFDLSK